MAQDQARWPGSVMGEVMQVSRSECYAYVQRQASADGGAGEAALLTRVQAIAPGDAAHLWEQLHGEATPGRWFCCGPRQSTAVDAPSQAHGPASQAASSRDDR
jgi:hypothetical protein